MDGPFCGSVRAGMVRGLALFVGGMCLLNLLGDLRQPGFDANLWWIDLRPAPSLPADAFLAALGLGLLGRAVLPVTPAFLRRSLSVLLAVAILVCLLNGGVYLRLLATGRLAGGLPLPFSWLMAAVLGGLLLLVCRAPAELPTGSWRHRARVALVGAVTLAVCFLGMPLAQMVCFGLTDYQRPGDVIVVFGARAYADGRPSQALADRVRHACRLYHAGMAPTLLMSGGPGDGAVTEPQAMRTLAMELGVRAEDILLDEGGLNTAATVANTTDMLGPPGTRQLLAVSHFYHLPRVKMAYQRAGWEVATVPCTQSAVLSQMPRLMVREIAAIWYYYLRPLWP